MMIDLYEYQKIAVSKLKTGSILCGGVGSGKSLTALKYYFDKHDEKSLYIITTAAKRDRGEWLSEVLSLGITPESIDSWNNIPKYKNITGAFFIFDEQRVVGSGAWVKSFLKIAKKNSWILLSATPGDTWLDYIPVFIANGFYKNRTEFLLNHVVWSSFTKFPKVDHYVEVDKLQRLKHQILVNMDYQKKTETIIKDERVEYDKDLYTTISKKRWNPYKDMPIKDVSELFSVIRKAVNSDESRFSRIQSILEIHGRVIIFYNFNYELEILKRLSLFKDIEVAEYNGRRHDPIPKSLNWVYLVQYNAGAEGWNCIETNAIIFYSLNYSYRIMVQSAGRIDRLNTPFPRLFYYRLISESAIDQAILRALNSKRSFNESSFLSDLA